MSTASFVSIEEFLSLTRLEARELCSLLSAGELTGRFADDGSLQIDVSTIDLDSLLRSSILSARADKLTSDRLEEEEIASEVVEFLEQAIEDALELAKSWHSKLPS